MDFVSVRMNATSVGDEFRMLLRRVTSKKTFQIFEKSSYNIGAKERKQHQQQQQKSKRKERESNKSPLAHVKPFNSNKNPSLTNDYN